VIDVDDIGLRWRQAEPFLDERSRRLLAANEALAHGYGGVSAGAKATGLAWSTINRGIREFRSGRNEIGSRVRRAGGGRKSAVVHQPDLPAALETLIEDAIRGDPCSPLRWVSRSLRHLVKALAAQGFQASQRVVANLLREQNYSCQASRKTREGGNHPDRDAQFAHINATVKAAIAAGEPAISVDTKKKEACWGLQEQRPRATPQGRSGAGPGARLQDPGTRQGVSHPRPTLESDLPHRNIAGGMHVARQTAPGPVAAASLTECGGLYRHGPTGARYPWPQPRWAQTMRYPVASPWWWRRAAQVVRPNASRTPNLN